MGTFSSQYHKVPAFVTLIDQD